MDKLLMEFNSIIKKETDILDEIAKLVQDKQQLIIKGQVAELDRFIQKEALIISNLEKMEAARFKLQCNIASKMGIGQDKATAGVILGMIINDYPYLHKTLKELIEHMDWVVKHIKMFNKHNNELIEQSLDYIEYIQTLLVGDVAGTYSPSGVQIDERGSRPSRYVLDRKA